MRLVLAAVCLAGVASCIDPIDPRWQLDHDHVIAARATPPRIRAGEGTNLDALVAHEDGPVTIEDPMTAELANPPAEMARTLTYEDGTWRLKAPDAATLASARPALGLPDDAPIPVDILLTFPDIGKNRAAHEPFRVKKTVWLGEPSKNPTMPQVLVGDTPVTDEVVVAIGKDTYVSVDVPDGIRVNWLTNVGELFQDDVKRAFVRVKDGDRLEGQLVCVIRDDDGGTAWQVFSMRAD